MSVINGYQIQGVIAKGGMATIYLALQNSLQRQVALKVLNPKLDMVLLKHFLDESRIIASLKHPNVIPVFDVGRVGVHFYHAMEYLEGGDLESKLLLGVTHHNALEIILELADALYLVHSKGIIHGDIKPANIVFRNDNGPVLTDFGISKRTGLLHTKNLPPQEILASPSYASPEVMLGQNFNQKVDIYSLGIVLYEMLVGMKPYQGDTQVELVAHSIQQPIPLLPNELKPLQPLLEAMLAKDPIDRIGDARMVSNYIKKYLRDHPDKNNSIQSNDDDVILEYVSHNKKLLAITLSKVLWPLFIVLFSVIVALFIWFVVI
jgi:serine/threonine-protein kinase PpkA